MRILSFDVGIKNLAYCYLDVSGTTTTTLLDWKVLDLLHMTHADPPPVDVSYSLCTSVLSTSTKKNVKVCGKRAKYQKNAQCFCEKHAKLCTEWLIPKRAYEPTSLMKLKNPALEALLGQHQLTMEGATSRTKKAMVEVLGNYYETKMYRLIGEPVGHAGHATTAKTLDLITLGRNMFRALDALPLFQESPPDVVLIENQISTLASRMKTVQGELTMYYVMRFPAAHIEYISSKNKLKSFVTNEPVASDSNAKYKQHKRDGITYATQLLQQHPGMQAWLPSLATKKKDDLADCFLQGMYWIHNCLGRARPFHP
jgi:hypothetical protein